MDYVKKILKDKIKSAAASCFYHSPWEVQSESVDPFCTSVQFFVPRNLGACCKCVAFVELLYVSQLWKS